MTRICWNGTPIGVQTPVGKTLDKTAFLALRPVDRLRAYLCLVWPGARSNTVLSRVCGVRREDIKNFLKTDLRDGVAIHPERGRWKVRPTVLRTVGLTEEEEQ